MKRVLLCAVLLFCIGTAAAPMNEADAVRFVLTANPVPADLFSQRFLAQVPASQITTIRDSVTAPLGTFQRAHGGAGRYTAYFTHGTLKVLIHLDNAGKIDGLYLREPTVTGVSIQDAQQHFAALPGEVSYIVEQDGKEIAARNADQRYGVGSTFKLAVLNALRKDIDGGKRKWTDVVRLHSRWKSLPSGVLQTWPDGTALTLQTLATVMISMSDNTAADALIHVVGQKAIAPYAYGNTPFMTTREMVLLKSKGNEALRAQYRSGSAAQRSAILAQLDGQPAPDLAQLDEDPALADIEWHFSVRELCTLMRGVYELPLMSVNPGLASPAQWKRIAYKGGSDFGVMNMTTWLQAKNGTSYCVSATWNNRTAPLDETKFNTAYTALIGSLKRE